MTRRRARTASESERLEDLGYLGPKSAAWLRAIGVETLRDLRRVGVSEAYGRVSFRFGSALSRNLLYALAGAMEGRAWNSFTAAEKRALCEAAGLDAPPRTRPRTSSQRR